MKKIIFSFLCLLSLQIRANVFAQKKAHDAYQAGDFEKAQSAYTQMLTEKPYDAQNNYNLGCALHKQKKFEDAQNYFNRAIEYATPDSKLQEQSLFNRGNNFVGQKQWDEAIADYKKVLKMNPNNESAKKNLKAAEQMKKEQKKQEEQQKDKNKDNKKDKNKDKKDQQKDSSNQDQQSGDDSDQDDQSSDQKKDQQGNQKKSSQGKPKDQKGDQEKEGDEKEQSKQEQEDGLKKSKNQKSKDQKDREKQNQKDAQHKKSSQKSTQNQSTGSDDDGKEEKVELNDAYAQEMMGKPSDDDRLEKRSAMLLEKLDDYEKNIQKKLLQMNVTKQGAQKHGQKNW